MWVEKRWEDVCCENDICHSTYNGAACGFSGRDDERVEVYIFVFGNAEDVIVKR